MSDHIKFVAQYITEEVHIFNEEEEIADGSRRDFIRRVSSATVGGTTSPAEILKQVTTGTATTEVAVAVGKAIRDMTNSELAETPEDLWLPYISSYRLNKFISEYPNHMPRELVSGFAILVRYLQSGEEAKEGNALRIFNIVKSRINVNASKLILMSYTKRAKEGTYGLLAKYNPESVAKAAAIAGLNLDNEFIEEKTKELRGEVEPKKRTAYWRMSDKHYAKKREADKGKHGTNSL